MEVLERFFAARQVLKRFPSRIGIAFPMDKVIKAISLFPTVRDVVNLIDVWSLIGNGWWCLLAVRLMFLRGHIVRFKVTHIPNGRATRRKSIQFEGMRCELADDTERSHIWSVKLASRAETLAGKKDIIIDTELHRFLMCFRTRYLLIRGVDAFMSC